MVELFCVSGGVYDRTLGVERRTVGCGGTGVTSEAAWDNRGRT